MTTEVQETETQGTETQETPQALREAADRSKGYKSRAESAERELAFYKAGIPADNPKFKYFIKGYDGELTKEAVLAEAKAAGLIEEPRQEQTPEQQQELAAQQRVVAASAGSTPETAGFAAAKAQMEETFQAHGVAGLEALLRQSGIPTATDG